MKMNKRLYNVSVTTPFVTQTLNNDVRCELHYMNENPFYAQYALKGNFAVWSTLDGKTYKLYIDRGYYEVMKDLYDVTTNNIWLDFYDDIGSLRKKYLSYSLPVSILIIVISFYISTYVLKNNNIFLFGMLFTVIFGVFLANKFMTNLMNKKKYIYINQIKKKKGSKKFEKIIEAQTKYSEKFFSTEQKITCTEDEEDEDILELEEIKEEKNE